MTTRPLAASAWALLMTAVFLGFGGCQAAKAPGGSDDKELMQLGNGYMDFFRARGNTPADEDELKEYLASSLTDVRREILGITDISKLFVSTRDGKPFVVRYGITLSKAPPSGEVLLNGDVIAYEAVGQGGYRHVFSSMGELTELKFDDLVKLVPDAK